MPLQLRVKSLLVKSFCCTECGIPIRAINSVELHPPQAYGRNCTMPRFFLEVCVILILLTSNQETQGNCKGVFAAADDAGMAPNLYLKELLDKGA